MADTKITPDRLADFLSIWVDTGGGFGITFQELESIRYAPSLPEAIRLAKQYGLEPKGTDVWAQAVRQAADDTSMAADQVLLSKMPEGYIPPNERGPEYNVILEQKGEIERLQSEMSTLNEIYALQEEEAKNQYSDLLFPTLPGGDPNQVAHLKMVASAEYSPWGPEQTRADVYRFMDMNLMSYEYDPAKRDYWKDQYTTVGAYVSGQELLAWSQLPGEERVRLEQKMVKAGLLDEEDGIPGYSPGASGMPQLMGMRMAMMRGTYEGIGYELALDRMIGEKQQADKVEKARQPTGGGRTRASFSVPASMRQIPDYESLQQEVINLFRRRMGRDPRDYEIGILADDLKSQYQTRNAEMIKAAKAAFDQAQSGVSGVMEVEIPDPQLRLQKFLETRYRPEIDRLDQIDDTRATNQLIVNAITQGSNLIGSRQ